MRTTKITRSGWAFLLTAILTSLLVLFAGTALAAGGEHTQSYTEHFHGTLTNELNEKRAEENGEEYEPPINPCNGDELQVTEETNIVNHITFFPAGDELWATFTQTSRITAADEETGVVYTGHSTFWGNFNVNRQNENSTFTGMIKVKGSDGSTILYHVVDHFTLLPGGKVGVEFEKPHLTCAS
jgi:hypothetical protein